MVKQLLEELQNNFSDHSVAISNRMSIEKGGKIKNNQFFVCWLFFCLVVLFNSENRVLHME